MFALGPATKVYVATGATDMRKGFEGLLCLVCEDKPARLSDYHCPKIELTRRQFPWTRVCLEFREPKD